MVGGEFCDYVIEVLVEFGVVSVGGYLCEGGEYVVGGVFVEVGVFLVGIFFGFGWKVGGVEEWCE